MECPNCGSEVSGNVRRHDVEGNRTSALCNNCGEWFEVASTSEPTGKGTGGPAQSMGEIAHSSSINIRVNWGAALLVGVGILSMLLPWGVYFDGNTIFNGTWQNANLIEMLGRSNDLVITSIFVLFFISTIITIRTTKGGLGQVVFSAIALGLSQASVSYPQQIVGIVGVPAGPLLGLIVGLAGLGLLWSGTEYTIED